MAVRQETYAFENAVAMQRRRLGALEALLDAGTIRHLEARGVAAGWRCLEVGAGGGSIAAWLCDRVGVTGSVVATDLDVTVLAALTRPNLEVRGHDVLADELPPAAFDLVHLRLLLAWLADPGPGVRGGRRPGDPAVRRSAPGVPLAGDDGRVGPEGLTRRRGVADAPPG
jgi:SAM-dependent methyltransferase